MNAGFRKSSGDLIWFLDADDILLPGAIDAVRRKTNDSFSKTHIRCCIVDSKGQLGRLLPRKWQPLPRGDISMIYGILGFYPSVPTSGNIYSRRFIEVVGAIPEKAYNICADAYYHDLAPVGGKICAIEEPLVGYRIHDKNNFAGRQAGVSSEWLSGKLERLERKWQSVVLVKKFPVNIVKVMFVFSPDYLNTVRSLVALGIRDKDFVKTNIPHPNFVIYNIARFMALPMLMKIYSRLWLMVSWSLYAIISVWK